MKKTYSIVFAALLLGACSKSEDPLNNKFGFADFPDNATKVILLEDFTGAQCNNCPKAAERARRFHAIKPKNIVVVAIHATPFAIPQAPDYPADFRTDLGADLYDFFVPPEKGIPQGLIDRADYPTKTAKHFDDWDNAFRNRLEVQGKLEMNGELSYDEDGKVFDIQVNLVATENIDAEDLHLCAFLVEDGIVAPQRMPDYSRNADYVHDHVLRAGFNGTFGTKIGDGKLASGEVYSTDLSVSKNPGNKSPDWNVDNCSAVVFVYDRTTFEVHQAFHLHKD